MGLRRAVKEDKSTVVDILAESFLNDPHVIWLLESCKNPNKLEVLLETVFDETLRSGEIYVNDENCAAALWNSEKGEATTIHSIVRDLRFLLRIGVKSVSRIVQNEKKIHSFYPTDSPYYHLYFIGVKPEAQGKGYASELMDPILEQKKEVNMPVYLETANPTNVKIYQKKGFSIISTIQEPGLEVYIMKKA